MTNATLARVTSISILLIAGLALAGAHKVASLTVMLDFPPIAEFEDAAKYKNGTHVMEFSDHALRDSSCDKALRTVQHGTADHEDHFQPVGITDPGLDDRKPGAEIQNGLSKTRILTAHLAAAPPWVAAEIGPDAINGEILRWKWRWPHFTEYSGAGVAPHSDSLQTSLPAMVRAVSIQKTWCASTISLQIRSRVSPPLGPSMRILVGT